MQTRKMNRGDFLYNASYVLDEVLSRPWRKTIIGDKTFRLDNILLWGTDQGHVISNWDEIIQRLQYKFRKFNDKTNIISYYTPVIATPKWYESKILDRLKTVEKAFKEQQKPIRIYRKKMNLIFRIIMLYIRRSERRLDLFTWNKKDEKGEDKY